MGFNVVYANKDKINISISNGTIPKESLILTNSDSKQAEAYYYDDSGKLKFITKKTKFNSMVDALNWIVSYDYKGETVSIFQNNQWTPYIVDEKSRFCLGEC